MALMALGGEGAGAEGDEASDAVEEVVVEVEVEVVVEVVADVEASVVVVTDLVVNETAIQSGCKQGGHRTSPLYPQQAWPHDSCTRLHIRVESLVHFLVPQVSIPDAASAGFAAIA